MWFTFTNLNFSAKLWNTLWKDHAIGIYLHEEVRTDMGDVGHVQNLYWKFEIKKMQIWLYQNHDDHNLIDYAIKLSELNGNLSSSWDFYFHG